ncbi:ArsR/SmtB family transcription factor [Agromyces silvae]|uniref:ArsR/SmtB family transcription factor n=1 Tax=Agromyces silvae TaxID=3388266 RepID=UPI00280B4BB8|nr:DUF5937 family protein [Agromyces protaetiae]
MDRNVVDFRLAPDDISAIRFGVSPGHELCHAVRVVLRPPEHPLQWGWLRAVRDRVPRDSFDLLALVIGAEGYFPDFFTTTPTWDVTPDDEAERLRRVPPELMRADLGKMIDRSTGARRAAIVRMREQPELTRELIADAWLEVWAALLAPVWEQLERILRADIAVRSRRIAAHGVAQMVGALNQAVEWHGDAVRVAMRTHREVLDCRGSGLVLVPSVMAARCAVLTEPPAQPTLFYPAQGVTETWARDSAEAARALAALVGPARAAILLAGHEPRTTSEVAADGGLAVSTASHHLTVLRNAGLMQSTRDGARVRHVRTPLGEAMVGGGV